MKLCVPIPCFYKCDPKEAIRKIAALGFHAVESYDWKSLDLDGVRAACQENGVSFLSVCTTEFRMTDPAYRGAFLSGLEESCAAAVRLGAPRLITQVGNDTGGTIVKEPQDVFWGGYHAYFADPDGYYWEVAWGPDFRYDKNGLLQF